ncbi:MAG: hypothetical protein LBG75_03350 [Candidatus Nomurabacteria bacterium]|jgi:hypothetical protein|nr:hypothetical protein [Candidatus Nomurabacteria bacterium]
MDKEKQDDITGAGMSAASKMDVDAIYSYDADTPPAKDRYVPDAALQEELDSIAKPPKRESRLLRNLMLIAAAVSVVAFIGWPHMAQVLNTPIDFGPLTTVCLFALVFFIYNVARLVQYIHKAMVEHSRASLSYHLIMPTVSFLVLFGVGYFEFKHQAVQLIITPAVREVSNEPTAVARCDRILRNLLDRGGGYYGYVYPGETEAHLNPVVCNSIFDWYFLQDKTASDDMQVFALHTPLHEAEHVRGIGNELMAECTSLEWTEDIMLKLGASRAEAKSVADRSVEYQQGRNSSASIASQKLSKYEGDCKDVPSQRAGLLEE